jgi:hypothetical protein
MPEFQLEVAIALAASACGSLVVFYLTRTKEGKIQLSINVEEPENDQHGHDPFDVTKAGDIDEGYPIEPDAFWESVRNQLMFIPTSLI